MKPHVLIDARLQDGRSGGIQQVVMGLAQGFSQLDSLQIRLTFLMLDGHTEWLKPYIPEQAAIVTVPYAATAQSHGALRLCIKSFVRDRFGHWFGEKSIRVLPEPDIVSVLNPDVVHFVHQNCFHTDRPCIFMPMDFQHEYFPEYFPKRTVMVRRRLYQKYSDQASSTVCISESCKNDAIKFLKLEKEKCKVIYCASPVEGYESPSECKIDQVKTKFSLPDKFLYYPAKTYPHKNHVNLIKAVKRAKDHGVELNVVCTGPLTTYYFKNLKPLVKKYGLCDKIRFLGWVDSLEVSVLYDLSAGLVFPSKFEGFGIPLVEAMDLGLPIACSNVSCIPEIVGDQAIYFDPESISEMTDSIISLFNKNSSAKRNRPEVSDIYGKYSWSKSAKEYQQLYCEMLSSES